MYFVLLVNFVVNTEMYQLSPTNKILIEICLFGVILIIYFIYFIYIKLCFKIKIFMQKFLVKMSFIKNNTVLKLSAQACPVS